MVHQEGPRLPAEFQFGMNWSAYSRFVGDLFGALFQRVPRIGLVVTVVAGIASAATGDVQARLMDSQQPMKMAAAEALYNTTAAPASFWLFTVGSPNGRACQRQEVRPWQL